MLLTAICTCIKLSENSQPGGWQLMHSASNLMLHPTRIHNLTRPTPSNASYSAPTYLQRPTAKHKPRVRCAMKDAWLGSDNSDYLQCCIRPAYEWCSRRISHVNEIWYGVTFLFHSWCHLIPWGNCYTSWICLLVAIDTNHISSFRLEPGWDIMTRSGTDAGQKQKVSCPNALHTRIPLILGRSSAK